MVVFRDYYPFGMEIGGRNYTDAQGYRYGYQGKYAEKDPETGWNAFELRMYDSRVGRWLSVDPAGQYHSPYVGMDNEPVNRTDPTGGKTDWVKDKNGNWFERPDITTRDQALAAGFVDFKAPGEIVRSQLGSVSAPYGPIVLGAGEAHYIWEQPSLSFLLVSAPKIIEINTLIAGNSAVLAESGVAAGNTWLLGALRTAGMFIGAMLTPTTLNAPNPASLPIKNPNLQPYAGNGNNKNNTNPHIVYKFSFTPTDGKTPVLKYGISDSYRYGFDRPEAQLPGLSAIYGSSTKYDIIANVNGRMQALMYEKNLVWQHVSYWGYKPREQRLP